MDRINLRIDGMSCGHCVASVREALEGVSGATVDRVEVGSAAVSYDPAVTRPEALEKAVRDAGYEAAVSNVGAA